MDWHSFPVYNSFIWTESKSFLSIPVHKKLKTVRDILYGDSDVRSLAIFLDLTEKQFFEIKSKYNDISLRLIKNDMNNEKNIESYKKAKKYLDSLVYQSSKKDIVEATYDHISNEGIDIYRIYI